MTVLERDLRALSHFSSCVLCLYWRMVLTGSAYGMCALIVIYIVTREGYGVNV